MIVPPNQLLQANRRRALRFMSRGPYYVFGFGRYALPAPVAEHDRSASPWHAHDLSVTDFGSSECEGSPLGVPASGISVWQATVRTGSSRATIISHVGDGECRTSRSSEPPPGVSVFTSRDSRTSTGMA